LLAVTKNPALAVGIYEKKGSVALGKDADFIIADRDFKIESVYVKGKKYI
jgi:N-acetylglucosamine-6-phosphate deacetylase